MSYNITITPERAEFLRVEHNVAVDVETVQYNRDGADAVYGWMPIPEAWIDELLLGEIMDDMRARAATPQEMARARLDYMTDDEVEELYDNVREELGRNYLGTPRPRENLIASIGDPDSTECAEYVLAWDPS